MKRNLLIIYLAIFSVGVAVSINTCMAPPRSSVTQPNVLIICIDTLRFDRLTPSLMPNVYALGEDEGGVSFTNAYSPAPWTLPSITSFFTGRIPSESRVLFPGDYMQDKHRTLAEVFRSGGWHTVGISANETVSTSRGFSQGFTDWIAAHPYPHKKATEVIDLAIENVPVGEPWFMYLHMMDPHLPYEAPEPEFRVVSIYDEPILVDDYEGPFQVSSGTYRDIIEYRDAGLMTEADIIRIRDLYDAEVRYVDKELGNFFAILDIMGVWDNTTVLVFADHGEELHERGGWGHGGTMYEEQIHVPAVLRDVSGLEVFADGIISTTTISRLLRSIATGETVTAYNNIFAEGMIRAELERKTIIDSHMMKLILPVELDSPEIYDLVLDPDELHNLYYRGQHDFYDLLSLMPGGILGPHEPNWNELEELRALGYLQ